MKRTIVLTAAILLSAAFPALALYDVSDHGNWPKTWPVALEKLRDQARTLVGPDVGSRHFAIPFKSREEFEAAWPHLLEVKTEGAPIFLMRGGNFFLDGAKAGIVVHCPPEGQADNPATPPKPIPGVKEPRMRWHLTNYIELVVDGEIVDLNRIPLPADTPIVDQRFEKSKQE